MSSAPASRHLGSTGAGGKQLSEPNRCRFCRSTDGEIVLDLGDQPAADYFPAVDEPGPDPAYPLQMWLCAGCGLAQLLVDPTVPEEPRGAEPAALVEQAEDAVERVTLAGWLPTGARTAEYGSPHGGSWLALLAARGLAPVDDGDRADVVLDCFGLMHSADQAAALNDRAQRVAPGGVLLLQYHSLATIMRLGQWNSLRHGHYAYYSTTALGRMLAQVGFVPRQAWRFELYGGTVLLAAIRHAGDEGAAETGVDASVRDLIAEEAALGTEDPARVRALQDSALSRAEALHQWLVEQKAAGCTVLGYGAASRAVALLCRAGVDSSLLSAVADASPAKRGRRMPATDIPVVAPADLITARPDAVALFLPDLMREIRRALPEVEAAGGHWVDVEALGSMPAAKG
jgi:C-methyltransferase C-terminal domain/Putative zinc binding domain/Methyltransferase domain